MIASGTRIALVAALIALSSAVTVGALAGVVPAGSQGVTAATASCTHEGRPLAGRGPLEWKPMPGVAVNLPEAGRPVARSGGVLFVTIGRHSVAAIDMHTLRVLPFQAMLPSGTSRVIAIAASPSAVYVALEVETSPDREVRAFDRRTGAPSGFRVTFDDQLTGIVYVAGKLVVAGRTRFTRGDSLVAYDGKTGRRVWSVPSRWPADRVVTDGSRLFVGVGDPYFAPGTVLAAFDVADGKAIPGWGRSISRRLGNGTVYGVDATRVFASANGAFRLVVTQATGRPVSLPELPPKATRLYYGRGRAILGEVETGNGQVSAVYSRSGKLIGTVCARYHVLALRDERHLVVVDYYAPPSGSRLLVLARGR